IPETSVWILRERSYIVRRRAIVSIGRDHCIILESLKAGRGRYDQGAVVECRQRLYAGAVGQDFQSAVLINRHGGRRSDPDSPGGILDDLCDVVVRQPITHGKRRELPVLTPHQTE